VRPCNLCPHMKRITLQNLYECLRDETNEVLVPEAMRKRAHKAVMDMINVKFDPVKGHFDPNLPEVDVKSIAAGMLADKLGVDNAQVGGIMDKLIGNGDKMDVAGLLGNLKENGLGDVAESWLGDGENQSISADQLKSAIGSEDLTQAAAQLGTDENSLLGGLQAALPQLVDKASSGGSLLDSLGGLGGLGGMAKKFL